MRKILMVLLAIGMHGVYGEGILPEKPMVVVITSYNNADWYQKNLDSVFCQNYNNYRVIYIDDASPDGTASLVEKYLNNHKIAHKVELIAHQERSRKLRHIYNTYHRIDDWDIIIRLDGDDWLAHPDVLKDLNQVYHERDAWVTYGGLRYSSPYTYQSRFIRERIRRRIRVRNKNPKGAKKGKRANTGKAKACKKLVVRYKMGIRGVDRWSNATQVKPYLLGKRRGRAESRGFHLCSSYAWLFKDIRLQDLLSVKSPEFEGQFHPVSDDVGVMYPMMEMAGPRHCVFTPNLSYVYNRENPLSGFAARKTRRLHQINSAEIRYTYPLYKPLKREAKRTISHAVPNQLQYDLFLVGDAISIPNNYMMRVVIPNSANHYILSCNEQCVELKGLNQDSVLSWDFADQQKRQSVCKEFAGYVVFINVNNVNNVVMRAMGQWLSMLHRTKARALFYANRNEQSPLPHRRQPLEDDIYAWQPLFDQNNDDGYFFNCGVLVCHRSLLPKIFASLKESNSFSSEQAHIHWRHIFSDKRSVVLIAQ